MTRRDFIAAASASALAAALPAPASAAVCPSKRLSGDTLYYNGRILTMTEKDAADSLANAPEAVLVKDGRIAAVGSTDELLDCECRRRVDLAGRCLMPGFIDAHSHLPAYGFNSLYVQLGGCTSHAEIIEAFKARLAQDESLAGGILIGDGYDQTKLAEGTHPDRTVLDQVSTDIAILAVHTSSHMMCLNSKALEIAGITADTPDPEGGRIGRFPDSREPNGFLEEAASFAIQNSLGAKAALANAPAAMKNMQTVYLANGITTAQDGAAQTMTFLLSRVASLLNQLDLDLVSYPLMSDNGELLRRLSPDLCGGYKNHLRIGGYKLILDGSPQGGSAWVTEPYISDEYPPNTCGYPAMPDEEVIRYLETALKQKQQVLAHCNGDAACEQFIRCYEAALRSTGCTADLRPVMIHCQLVRPDQLDRMKKLNMIASLFIGHVWYWGDVHVKNFGEERGSNISPARDALDRGVCVTLHQDTPITTPDMLHSVWCAVNRVSAGGSVIGPHQSISVYEALRAATVCGAYQYFEENDKGTIEVGKRADLIILDRSPLEVDEMEIRDIQVMETIKDGRTVWTR